MREIGRGWGLLGFNTMRFGSAIIQIETSYPDFFKPIMRVMLLHNDLIVGEPFSGAE